MLDHGLNNIWIPHGKCDKKDSDEGKEPVLHVIAIQNRMALKKCELPP